MVEQRRRRRLETGLDRRNHAAIFCLGIGILTMFPHTFAFQARIPLPIRNRVHASPPRLCTLAVAQQNNTTTPETVVESFAFFSDFDYDYYQTVEESATEKEELIPKESSAYCVIDPMYDLAAPYTSRLDSKSTFVDYTPDGLCVPAGPIGRLKEEIANLLNEPAVEIIIASVILLNALLVALSTLDSLSEFMPMILFAEIVVSTIFVVDFAARWFSSSRDAGKFVLDPQFGIDVLVVILPLLVTMIPDSIRDEVVFLPSALSKPSELFNLRLLRVLRLQRFLRDLDTFERLMERVSGGMMGTNKVQEWQLKLARVVSSLFTLLSVVSGLIYTAENAVNPDIDNYFDALYFSLTTRKYSKRKQ
jgi:Ion transport protein